jgi:hypothetical protein
MDSRQWERLGCEIAIERAEIREEPYAAARQLAGRWWVTAPGARRTQIETLD